MICRTVVAAQKAAQRNRAQRQTAPGAPKMYPAKCPLNGIQEGGAFLVVYSGECCGTQTGDLPLFFPMLVATTVEPLEIMRKEKIRRKGVKAPFFSGCGVPIPSIYYSRICSVCAL